MTSVVVHVLAIISIIIIIIILTIVVGIIVLLLRLLCSDWSQELHILLVYLWWLISRCFSRTAGPVLH